MEPIDERPSSVSIPSEQLPTAQPADESAEASARHLQCVDTLTQSILRHPSLDALLGELLERVQTIMHVDNVAILRLDEQRQELIMDTVRGPEEAVAARVHVPIGQGVAGRIFAERQPLVIDDLARVEVVNSFLHEHLHSLLGVPLLVEERAIGVIHVSTVQPRQFTTVDVQVLQIVADRIALAIDHVQLLAGERRARQETERLTQRLHALEAINDVVLQHLNVDDLVREMLARVSVVLGVDNVAILLPMPDQQTLILHSVYGPEQEVAAQVHVPIGQGVAGRIMATGKPLIIDDLATSDAANPFLRQRLHSLLGVPLQVEDRVIGVIHVSTIYAHQFTEDDLDLLRVVADRVALAIDHARAFAEAQQARREAEERAGQLAEVNQRMDSFLSIASHEMRTPLTSVLANIDLLLRRLVGPRADSTLTAAQVASMVPFLQRAQRQANRLNSLVSDLLDVGRIQADRLEIHFTRQDLRAIATASVEEQRQLAPQRTIALHLPDTPLFADLDADRISQVITNYLTNALKFSPPDQPITVFVKRQGGAVYLGVRDAGPGIAPADRERIWDRFHRIDTIPHQSGSYVGLGLGLYICRTIIAQHGGQVGVKGRTGRGSEFWFTVPLQTPAPDSPAGVV